MKDFVNPKDPWLYAAVIFGFILGVASTATPIGGVCLGAVFACCFLIWNAFVDMLFGKGKDNNDKNK